MEYNKNNNRREGERNQRKSFAKDSNGQRARRPRIEREGGDNGERRKQYASRDGEERGRKSFGRDGQTHRYNKPEGEERRYNNGEERPHFRREGENRGKSKFGARKYGEKSFGERKPQQKQVSKHTDTIRLNKYIANAGICSRREADKLIAAGSVTVNGKVMTEMGYQVKKTDVVAYAGETLKSERKRYFLMNKPKGYITTLDDPQERKTVMMLIDGACPERIYPVGRLDRYTTGLLLFTNDGELAKKLTHPSTCIHKIYQVELDKVVSKEDMRHMLEGIELEDGEIKVDDVQYVAQSGNKRIVGVTLHSGRNRIVRRIFEHLGYEVLKLDRVVFAGLTKKNISRGRYRELTEQEVNFLKMI